MNPLFTATFVPAPPILTWFSPDSALLLTWETQSDVTQVNRTWYTKEHTT